MLILIFLTMSYFVINAMTQDGTRGLSDLLMRWNRVAGFARRAGAVKLWLPLTEMLCPTNLTNLHKYPYNIVYKELHKSCRWLRTTAGAVLRE